MLSLIISLVAGALGGNGAAKLMSNLSLGTVGNSIAGILGGGAGAQILGMLSPSLEAAASSGAMDIGSILASVASGGVGGGALMAIIGMIKNMMNKG